MASPSYLTKRKGSQNWQLDILLPTWIKEPLPMLWVAQFGNRRHFIKSMETPDRLTAEIKAAPYVHYFRLVMFHAKAPGQQSFAADGYEHEDGYYDDLKGRRAFVAGPEITFLDKNGKPCGKAPNRPLIKWLMPNVPDQETADALLYFDSDHRTVVPKRFQPKPPNPDDALIEEYISEARLDERLAQDARMVWGVYKDIIDKPLSKATRDDGKKLAQFFFDQGKKRATVQKKVGWLQTAVRTAIKNNRGLTFNPFIDVLPPKQPGDERERRPFSEEQMAALWAALPSLPESDQVLWKLLAKTGMRLDEAYTISEEHSERGTGIRYVEVGTKTDASRRRVPLPLDIGLPDNITGRLFGNGTTSAVSKRMNYFIRKTLGLEKGSPFVLHSLRHRMHDVLDILDCPDTVARWIVGHARTDVHSVTYKKGPPMGKMLPYINGNIIDGTFKVESVVA